MYKCDFPPQRRELSGREGEEKADHLGEAAPVLRFDHTHRDISQRRVRLPDGPNQICALRWLKTPPICTEDRGNTQEKHVRARRFTSPRTTSGRTAMD